MGGWKDLSVSFSSLPIKDALSGKLGEKAVFADSASKFSLAWDGATVPVAVLPGKIWDVCPFPMAPVCGAFSLLSVDGGVAARVVDPTSSSQHEFALRPRILAAMRAHARFEMALGAQSVSDVNDAVVSGKFKEFVWASEALQERNLAHIAEALASGASRVALIAGPSSAGKTTSARRLAVQLRASGLKPIVLSLDDYYLDVDKMPSDDYEDPFALDIALLEKRVKALLAGDEVPLRCFDFKAGKGYDDNVRKMKMPLDGSGYCLIEGIHGLNPVIWEKLVIGGSRPPTIFVTALTHLLWDRQHPTSTADTRLLRRILRDSRTRGYSAAVTIGRWNSVRAGEEKWIFPFQETATHVFNSALPFELHCLALQTRPLLLEVARPNSGADSAVKQEAKRLADFLAPFYPASSEFIPPNSILREFVGGLAFDQ